MMMLLERVKVSAVTRTRTGRYRGLGVTIGLGQAPYGGKPARRPGPGLPSLGTCSPRRRKTGVCVGW